MKRTKSTWIAGKLSGSATASIDSSTWIEFNSVPADQVPDFINSVALQFRLSGGRWTCAGVRVSVDGELDTSKWRAMPLGLLMDHALEAANFIESKAPKLPTSRPQRGSRGPDLAFYRDIAALYRLAVQQQRRPVVWMAAQLGVTGDDSVEQTRRWIRTARQLGFLRASIAGKPGEAPKQKVRVKR
jgi:hypothetical protein